MSMRHLEQDNHDYDRATFASVRKYLRPGHLVYDIGAYDAITSGLAAEIVGGENLVIIEPAESNWATIKAYWEALKLATPHATFAGFVDSDDKPGSSPRDLVHVGSWPDEIGQFPVSYTESELRFRLLNYRNQDAAVAQRPSLRLDTIVGIAGEPAGILMDVEGAEFLALKGAEMTLRFARPYVWISVHPSFMVERFGHNETSLRTYMENLNYKEELLADDHEQHWFFCPKEKS